MRRTGIPADPSRRGAPAIPRRPFAALRWAAAAAACLSVPGAARAHATWFDGAPVPDWVTRSCCGPGDAHHLRPDQVHRVADGFRFDGYPGMVYDAQVLPSQDGEFWAFYKEARDADGQAFSTGVFCFFAPTWG